MKKDKDSFYISKKSKLGILIFIGISIVVVFIPRIIFFFTPEEKFEISSEQIKELRIEQSQRKEFAQFSFKKEKTKFRRPTAKFDPNNFSEKDWMKLGLSKKQTAVVLKFTSRGIYSNEQLQKIFVIPPELYALIKDSTIYPSKQYFNESTKPVYASKKDVVLIEVNAASQEELESIPGIGSFYAKNILKYRDRLGGFIKKEQLLEVWKMDIEKYGVIEKYIKVNTESVQLINLNSVKVEILKAHPYLNWNISNSIIKMREMKGGFKRIEEIKESVLIDEELFEKIKPYLSL